TLLPPRRLAQDRSRPEPRPVRGGAGDPVAPSRGGASVSPQPAAPRSPRDSPHRGAAPTPLEGIGAGHRGSTRAALSAASAPPGGARPGQAGDRPATGSSRPAAARDTADRS